MYPYILYYCTILVPETILNLRQLIEKAYEYYVLVYLCFVDYEKAFDSVQWPESWDILLEMGVPNHLVSLLKTLYSNSQAIIELENSLSEKRPVRKGCVLLPLRFNIYGEYIIRCVLEDWQGCVMLGGGGGGSLICVLPTTPP